MSFTAKDVQALRERTGCGMMDCKKALTEAEGTMDKAVEFLREKGLAAAEKKSSRIAAEGLVFTKYDEGKQIGAIVEVNSETDFVAKNDSFRAFVEQCADTVIACNPSSVEELNDCKVPGTDNTVAELLREKILTIGENMKIRRFERIEGAASFYIHGGGRIGVAVKFDVDEAAAKKDAFKEYAKDVAMQVAAAMPAYVNKEDVPADVIDKEKEILTAQAINEGKPANIAEKMVNGRINKYYKEVCLVEQPYIKDGDLTVAKFTEKTAAEIGAPIKIISFVRYEKGEGLEKKSDNFAEEVASMVK